MSEPMNDQATDDMAEFADELSDEVLDRTTTTLCSQWSCQSHPEV